MADLSGFLCLEQSLIYAASVARRVNSVHHVQLIYIDIVCAKFAKRSLKILFHLVSAGRSRLCSDIKLIAHAFECRAKLRLAVRICSCSVEIAHPAFISSPQEPDGIFHVSPLHRQRSESVLRHRDAGFSKCKISHLTTPLSFG